VVEHAQNIIFLYGRNGRFHILLTADTRWRLAVSSCVGVAHNGPAHSALLFPYTSPPSRGFVPSHSNRTLPSGYETQYAFDPVWEWRRIKSFPLPGFVSFLQLVASNFTDLDISGSKEEGSTATFIYVSYSNCVRVHPHIPAFFGLTDGTATKSSVIMLFFCILLHCVTWLRGYNTV
jgi:hypothetical protein